MRPELPPDNISRGECHVGFGMPLRYCQDLQDMMCGMVPRSLCCSPLMSVQVWGSHTPLPQATWLARHQPFLQHSHGVWVGTLDSKPRASHEVGSCPPPPGVGGHDDSAFGALETDLVTWRWQEGKWVLQRSLPVIEDTDKHWSLGCLCGVAAGQPPAVGSGLR